MNSQTKDLTDEAFAELLCRPADAFAGAAAPEAEVLRAALRSYRTETLQWAERRSSTQTSLQPAARRSRMWAAVPQWSLAAVAVISIAAGVAHVYDRPDVNDASEETVATAPAASVVVPAARTSPSDIAADNRLLSSIDQALSYRAELPIDNLGLKPSHSARTTASGDTE
jgi:hypothetical protein